MVPPASPATTPGTGTRADDRPEADDVDPTQRVHHHAKLDARPQAGTEYTTLCGLRLRPRPEAKHMPCCPMCAAEMEAMGRRCRQGPR